MTFDRTDNYWFVRCNNREDAESMVKNGNYLGYPFVWAYKNLQLNSPDEIGQAKVTIWVGRLLLGDSQEHIKGLLNNAGLPPHATQLRFKPPTERQKGHCFVQCDDRATAEATTLVAFFTHVTLYCIAPAVIHMSLLACSKLHISHAP